MGNAFRPIIIGLIVTLLIIYMITVLFHALLSQLDNFEDAPRWDRELFPDGTVVAIRHGGLIADYISAFTLYHWNHVGIVFGNVVYEASDESIRQTYIGDWMDKFDDRPIAVLIPKLPIDRQLPPPKSMSLDPIRIIGLLAEWDLSSDHQTFCSKFVKEVITYRYPDCKVPLVPGRIIDRQGDLRKLYRKAKIITV